MKRIALIIAASFVVLAGIFAGAIMYLRPAFIFGAPPVEATTPHGVPNYTEDASEESQAKRYTRRLVEQLGAVQDRIIRGDRDALSEQQKLLNDIARELHNFGQDEWSDYVNVRTSLIYLLSGGDANVLKPVIEQKSLNAADQVLAEGIVSFAEGHTKAARKRFEGIDPRTLDVNLVGPFALAKASLYLEDDHQKAVALLDDARLASPHTAIDEASARREIPILLASGDTSRAMMLATTYIHEFGKSIYAWKLYRDFAGAVAKHEELDKAETVDRLIQSLDPSDMQPASELFVDLAGEALLQGHLKLAKAAAGRALKIDGISPENLDKARLYAAAADAPSGDAGSALKALDQIAADRLSDDDTEIREVAGFIAKTVIDTDPRHVPPRNAQANKSQIAPSPSAANAQTALNRADAVLKEADSLMSRSAR
jgi:chemotaxis protein MotC